jgi:hypothetical protein
MNTQSPGVLWTIGDDSDVLRGSMLVPEERYPTLFSMPVILIDSCAIADAMKLKREMPTASVLFMRFSRVKS